VNQSSQAKARGTIFGKPAKLLQNNEHLFLRQALFSQKTGKFFKKNFFISFLYCTFAF
jgi:hypothetical protein